VAASRPARDRPAEAFRVPLIELGSRDRPGNTRVDRCGWPDSSAARPGSDPAAPPWDSVTRRVGERPISAVSYVLDVRRPSSLRSAASQLGMQECAKAVDAPLLRSPLLPSAMRPDSDPGVCLTICSVDRIVDRCLDLRPCQWPATPLYRNRRLPPLAPTDSTVVRQSSNTYLFGARNPLVSVS